jgi:hypothetical protein
MRPNSVSPELVKNIACVDQKINKFEQKEVHIGPTQNCLKEMRPNLVFFGPFRD